MTDPIDWVGIGPDVAKILLGDPNPHRSNSREWRWGNKGSMAFDVGRGLFRDHEASEGGGVAWLIQRETGENPNTWLERSGFTSGNVDYSLITAKRKQAEAKQSAEKTAKSDRAAELYASGVPIEGTPAETYLRSRSITQWPDELRFSGGALVFPFRTDSGAVIAVQRIMLDGHGAKLDKLSLGPIGQGVCILPGKGDLHLAEGPETGLSVWMATGSPVMICAGPISAKRIAQAGSGPIVLASDAADDGAPVLTTLGRACDAAAEAGITYRLAVPDGKGGTDWNDTLQSSGLDAVRAMLGRGEWIGTDLPATYDVPTGSVEDARATVANALAEWADVQDIQAMRVSTGVGKSHAARLTAVDMVQSLRAEGDGNSVVIAVPRHDLGREYVTEMRKAGVSVGIWKSRTQPDDDQPGKMMCHRPEDAKKAEIAGVDPQETLCSFKGIECPFIAQCGRKKMEALRPDIWLVPHAMLWNDPPSAIQPAALIVDEDPTGDAFAGFDAPFQISLNDLRSAMPGLAEETAADLLSVTSKIADVVEAGAITTDAIRAAFNGKTEIIAKMRTIPFKAADKRPALPTDTTKTLISKLGRVVEINRRASRLYRILSMVADALTEGSDTVPGLTSTTAKTKAGDTYRVARMHWRKTLADKWAVPTMIMSATLSPDLLRHIWPDLGKVTIAEAAMPHVTIRQITDSANPQSSLLNADGSARGRIKRLTRYAEVRAAELGGTVLLIAQKKVREALEKHGLPDNVETAHFNALSGLDAYKDVRGLIITGRPLPGPYVPEMMREILTGKAGQTLPKWYDKTEAAPDLDGTGRGPRIYSQNGHGGAITYGRDSHPDETTEQIRWLICEGEIIQGIGRGRGVNRSAQDPLQIDVLTHYPLPLAVDEAGPFSDFEPTAFDLMAARGVIVPDTSAKGAKGIIQAMLPDLFPNERAVKDWLKRSRAQNRISIIYGSVPVRDETQDDAPSKVHNRISIIYGNAPLTDGRLKLDGARYAVPCLVRDGAILPTGATFTPETKAEPMPETETHAPPKPGIMLIAVNPAPIIEPQPCLPPGFEPMLYSAELPADNGAFDLFEVTKYGEVLKVWDAQQRMSCPRVFAAE